MKRKKKKWPHIIAPTSSFCNGEEDYAFGFTLLLFCWLLKRRIQIYTYLLYFVCACDGVLAKDKEHTKPNRLVASRSKSIIKGTEENRLVASRSKSIIKKGKQRNRKRRLIHQLCYTVFRW